VRSGAPVPPPTKLTAKLTPARLVLATLGLALVGWVFGYGVSTRVLFPAPPSQGDLFEVPSLQGLGLASAEERLVGAGLTLGTVDSLQHPSVGAGVVLGQSPLPTQVASPETPVRVTVSTGPQTRAIPDVRRIEGQRARTVLESSGFIVSVDSTRAEQPRGQVVSMVPEPDQVVAIPSRVQITVSTGPPIVVVPLVLGVAQDAAVEMLEELGLVVAEVEEVFRFGRDQGVVVEQEPAADTEIERGGSVRLKVGRRGVGREQ
jgi:serine/threonine-protein kinase